MPALPLNHGVLRIAVTVTDATFVPGRRALQSQTIAMLQLEFCKRGMTLGKDFDSSLALMTARLSMEIIGNYTVIQ
jgi:hypothetical protein